MAYNSMANIVSSVKWFASLLDPPSIAVFETVRVAVSLKGLWARLSRPVRQKLPFTIVHLCKLYSYFNLSDLKQLFCWCAMLIAFLGAFEFHTWCPRLRESLTL